jgi:hypothetical protein
MAKIIAQMTLAAMVILARRNGYVCPNTKDRVHKCPKCQQEGLVVFQKKGKPKLAACHICGFRKLEPNAAAKPAPEPTPTNTCEVCGKDRGKNKRFCSRACQQAGAKQVPLF